jgi:hypothetical protein
MSDDLKELKRLAEAATPGPWRKSNHANSPRVYAPETDDRLGIEIQIRGNGNRDDNRKNANFIAATNPAAILKLLAELEQAKADAALLRGILKSCAGFLSTIEGINEKERELSFMLGASINAVLQSQEVKS